MGILNPSADDADFEAANTKVGWNKAVRRCMRLRGLLERALLAIEPTPGNGILISEIEETLKKSFYDEPPEFPTRNWEKRT